MEKRAILDQIESNIRICRKCRLCELAKNAVPGEGDIDSEIVFVGEAPGANEDLTGRPFVGRAGKLLEVLLSEIGLKRENVWIGNIIKHRPPENRDPLPDEIAPGAVRPPAGGERRGADGRVPARRAPRAPGLADAVGPAGAHFDGRRPALGREQPPRRVRRLHAKPKER